MLDICMFIIVVSIFFLSEYLKYYIKIKKHKRTKPKSLSEKWGSQRQSVETGAVWYSRERMWMAKNKNKKQYAQKYNLLFY